MMSDYDEAYRQRLAEAITRAVLEVSVTGDDAHENVVLKTGEIFDALLLTAAIFISSSDQVAGARDRKVFCETAAETLKRQIKDAQDHLDLNSLFEQVQRIQ